MAKDPLSMDESADKTEAAARLRETRRDAQAVRDDLNTAAASADDVLAALRSDLARLSETVASLVAAQAGHAREAVSGAASDIYEYADEHVRGVTEDLSEKIERNPFTAVAIAFGAGMLFSMLNRSR
jgi:ElaB/YqjD/DUF883 family membrane-anchored ribosome-binding protein